MLRLDADEEKKPPESAFDLPKRGDSRTPTAFMTGMERNSDVVLLASYAPLFANVNYKKWNPDLIDFDSSRAYGIPSYYVQKMFNENREDVVLPVTVNASEAAPVVKSGAIGVGTWRT